MNDFYLMKEFEKWYPVSREDGKLLIGTSEHNGQFCNNCNVIVETIYDRCSRCGGLNESYQELIPEDIPVSVVRTDKFTFALTFQQLLKIFMKLFVAGMEHDITIIVDSYGEEYSVEQFITVLDDCSVQEIDNRLNWTD